MGQGESKNKGRLIETLLIAFVIVTMALLIVQLGTNVLGPINAAMSQTVQPLPASRMGESGVQPTPRATLDPNRWGEQGGHNDA